MTPRVAGIDPGSVTLDLCCLEDGRVFREVSLEVDAVRADPSQVIDALARCGPLDLVVAPSGYGLPLLPQARVGEHEISLMLLVRSDEGSEDVGIGGMRRMLRALLAAQLPLVFTPGVIHLPTVPPHRKWNRIDMGTADKVCSAAFCIHDQAQHLRLPYERTTFIMLELGGAFTAALAVDGGRIVDGLGGSSGPLGLRACGALDAEVAYLLGSSISKRTVFTGGALADEPDGGTCTATCTGAPRTGDARRALCESAVKAVLSLTAAVPSPREVLLTGRLSSVEEVVVDIAAELARIAPVRRPSGLGGRTKAAAQGAALLADGLTGGRFAPVVETMDLRNAHGSALDHLRLAGADRIRLA